MALKRKEYSNGEITVIWQPGKCIHSENCFHGLSSVFNPEQRPWVKMDAASSDEIKKTIDTCPSGALSYKRNDKENTDTEPPKVTITVSPAGPYIISGAIQLTGADKQPIATDEKIALCRCGASKNKPFCDGSHTAIGFEG